MAWATKEFARKLWKSAPADDDVLTAYLDAAKPAIVACAEGYPIYQAGLTGWVESPAGSGLYTWQSGPIPDASIPATYVMAQVMQARNQYNAGQAPTNQGGDFSGGGYGISSFPLDWHVVQLLRPARGMGAIA